MPLGPYKTSTEVQNIQGTSQELYRIPNLKARYMAAARTRRTTCCAVGCGQPYQATAHVLINDAKKGGNVGNSWWLVPTCNGHNNYQRNEYFEVNPSTIFVSVPEVR